MKKVYYIISFLIIIIVVSIFLLFLDNNTKEITRIEDSLILQQGIQNTFISHGYTIDKPNIIINPYGNSPLTALIIFETEEYVEPSVILYNNDDTIYFTYTSQKSRIHYLPIYGLYLNNDTKISIKYNDTVKYLTISTTNIEEFEYDKSICVNKFNIGKTNTYLYGCDDTGNIRWILNGNYSPNIIQKTNNNHIITSTNRLMDSNLYTGIMEIDFLGKIYFEYTIPSGYSGLSYLKEDNNILLLSNNKILEIDNQNGSIVKKINNYLSNASTLYYDQFEQIIYLSNNEEEITISYDDNKIIDNYIKTDINTSINLLYDGNINLKPGVRFNELKSTSTVNVNLSLLNYKEKDISDKIQITNEFDRLIVEGNFNKDDVIYIILNKMSSQKIYNFNVEKNVLYINKKSLTGKYSIYVQINKNLYKLNNHINA